MGDRGFVTAIGYILSALVTIAIVGICFAYLSHIHTEDHQADLVREQTKAAEAEVCSHIELEANRVLCLQAVNGR